MDAMGRGGRRLGAGRPRKHPGGSRKVTVLLPEAFARHLVDREARPLRDILADAVRAAYPQFPWDSEASTR